MSKESSKFEADEPLMNEIQQSIDRKSEGGEVDSETEPTKLAVDKTSKKDVEQ